MTTATLTRPEPAAGAPSRPAFDEARLEALMGRLVTDAAAAATAPLVLLGDRLGLYKALAARGPSTSTELAEATGTLERYVREWLAAQAAAAYVDYDSVAGRFSLSPEQALAFAADDSPAYFVGAFEIISANFQDSETIQAAFRAAAASAGMNTTTTCSAAWPASSAPATSPIWWPTGCRRWTGWLTS